MAFAPARLADPGFPGSEKRRKSSDAILRMQNVETDLGILDHSVESVASRMLVPLSTRLSADETRNLPRL